MSCGMHPEFRACWQAQTCTGSTADIGSPCSVYGVVEVTGRALISHSRTFCTSRPVASTCASVNFSYAPTFTDLNGWHRAGTPVDTTSEIHFATYHSNDRTAYTNYIV
jgi:hypothetical protein